MYLISIIKMIIGLGILLFGMFLLADALKRMALRRVKLMINKISDSVLINILIGIFVTVMVPSSSGIIIMLIGLMDAGVINLKQASGIIMGSNIGTTFSTQVISLNIFDKAPNVIPFGILLYIFSKTKKVKYLSQFITGFGLLFYGISYMGNSVIPLKQNIDFVKLLNSLNQNYFEGLIFGVILVGIIQSSTAGIVMLQAFVKNGFISLNGAVPVVLGINISTCFDTIMASLIAKNPDARRAAFFHLFFNLIGTSVFIFMSRPIADLSRLIGGSDPSFQVAIIHTIFNVGTTFLILFILDYLLDLLKKLIKF